VHAGHEPAMLYAPAVHSFQALAGEGMSLGVMEDWVYQESAIALRTGQIILIVTDGIKEACNPQNEMFGADRLMTIMRDNAQKPAREILKTVYATLERFRHPVARQDDETLIVIKVL